MSRAGWGRAGLVLALVALFLTLGLPRVFNRDSPPAVPHGDAGFAEVCRAHGGTPAPGSQRRCTVRYGSRVYLMDAVGPSGFDADTARFQRKGCVDAARRNPGETFVYHADTGVCERRT